MERGEFGKKGLRLKKGTFHENMDIHTIFRRLLGVRSRLKQRIQRDNYFYSFLH